MTGPDAAVWATAIIGGAVPLTIALIKFLPRRAYGAERSLRHAFELFRQEMQSCLRSMEKDIAELIADSKEERHNNRAKFAKLFDWWWQLLPRYLFFLLLGLIAVLLLVMLQRWRRSAPGGVQ